MVKSDTGSRSRVAFQVVQVTPNLIILARSSYFVMGGSKPITSHIYVAPHPTLNISKTVHTCIVHFHWSEPSTITLQYGQMPHVQEFHDSQCNCICTLHFCYSLILRAIPSCKVHFLTCNSLSISAYHVYHMSTSTYNGSTDCRQCNIVKIRRRHTS